MSGKTYQIIGYMHVDFIQIRLLAYIVSNQHANAYNNCTYLTDPFFCLYKIALL